MGVLRTAGEPGPAGRTDGAARGPGAGEPGRCPPASAATWRPGAREPDSKASSTAPSFRPGAEDSGAGISGDTSVPEADADAASSNPVIPVVQRDQRRQAIRLTAAAAASTFFAYLYAERGDDVFLVLASTALALMASWIGEKHLGRRGRP